MYPWDDAQMTIVRLLAAALSAWTPAAAQVLEVPSSAARAPLSPVVAARAAAPGSALAAVPSLAPSLLAASLSAPLSALAPRSAAAAAASVAPAASAAAPSVAPPAAFAAALAAPPSALAAPAAAASAPAADPALPQFSLREGGPPRARAAVSAPPNDFDAFFDGRAPSAAAALDAGPSAPASSAAAAPLADPGAPRRAVIRRAVAVAAPLVFLAAGVAAPHASLAAMHWLGQGVYWLANPLAFLFTVPQIHRMLARRSGEVSPLMTVFGLFSAIAAAACFAFDDKTLMMFRNLAQAGGFAVMLGLELRFARVRGPRPSTLRAIVEIAAIVAVLTAALFAAAPAFTAAVRAAALMGPLLVPLQTLAGFGFTYMMYAQLKKMLVDHSTGDSSPQMMWAFLGTKAIWIWSLATLLALSAAPAWITLGAGAAFSAVCWLISHAVLTRVLTAKWGFLPERIHILGRDVGRAALGEAAAFVALSALVGGLSLAGALILPAVFGIGTAGWSAFAMYVVYTVQTLVACVATLKALDLRRFLSRVEAPAAPAAAAKK